MTASVTANDLKNAIVSRYYIGLVTELPVDMQSDTISKPDARPELIESMTPNAMQ